MFFFPRFLLSFYIFGVAIIICFATSPVFGAILVPNEVATLKKIGTKLGKNWNFNVDPCIGKLNWTTLPIEKDSENNVTCNCTFSNGNLCHVTAIILKEQNLAGILPTEVVDLPYLQSFDVSRNYLNGTIPREWGSTKLVNISLLGNRLTGPIPKEIGNISTLTSFVVEFNQFSGELPADLGNLTQIQRLLLSSNKFTGELPATFAGLTALIDFRIGDNLFTGKIPNFIQNWKNLNKLVIQASGMKGPIPSGIAVLENVTDLRISDLNGSEATNFPSLGNMKKLEILILRSCNIIGNLPDYLKDVTTLKTLDLSFNKLNGEIPRNYTKLYKVKYIYLTGNLLTGSIPESMLTKGDNMDLSYNNFSNETSGTLDCQQPKVNLFGNFLEGNNSGVDPCLKSFRCPQNWYSFHINCGGEEVTIGNTKYEGDIDEAAPSKFYQSTTNWGVSSTGHFLDNSHLAETYILTNKSKLLMNSFQLYTKARLSPLSLTYYGFCLGNGNYTVNLQFAEIEFTNDKTYKSLGRRLFDVYIQEVLVLKDFNIADEASGVSKEIIKTFPAVVVNSSTLEIRFQWAGKGTTAIPVKGVYGPLISAISVVNPENSSISAGAVVGIVAAVAVIVLLILGVLWWKGCLQREEVPNDLRGLDLQTGAFTLRQIKAATNNFDASNKIGEGGFGPVYKGLLADGTIIAVKQLSSKSKQGNREFVNEIGMISALQHPHLVKLHGCCIEGNQLLLVYEYMENNCLARALFGPQECQLNLDWPTRLKICVGIARGLAYLHEESRLKIVHRDIKATNVLLDKNLNAKISDFGLAKLDDEDNTHISTRIAGTFGYMAPEYAMRGYLTDKADVYSFGVVALEIISGRSNTIYKTKDNSFYLLDWALVLKEKKRLTELIDPKLGNDYNKQELMAMINVALLCTNVSPVVRPTMSSVVSMLEGRTVVKDITSETPVTYEEMNFQAMKDHYENNQEESLIENQVTHDGLWSGSSTSAVDLYPINSSYLKSRA